VSLPDPARTSTKNRSAQCYTPQKAIGFPLEPGLLQPAPRNPSKPVYQNKTHRGSLIKIQLILALFPSLLFTAAVLLRGAYCPVSRQYLFQ
jgi:hypothetical protein